MSISLKIGLSVMGLLATSIGGLGIVYQPQSSLKANESLIKDEEHSGVTTKRDESDTKKKKNRKNHNAHGKRNRGRAEKK